jgi:hypothetical protein
MFSLKICFILWTSNLHISAALHREVVESIYVQLDLKSHSESVNRWQFGVDLHCQVGFAGECEPRVPLPRGKNGHFSTFAQQIASLLIAL